MALSKLTILNERYVLRNKLGEPGLYDTTYLAWNLMKKETAVVVREFNPTFLMNRSENGEKLIPSSGPAERLFDYGLNCFIREADATGLIKHPNVIHQQTYFRENDTAYSVSAYHPGATLAAVLQGQAGKLQERAAFAIIVPLLDGLIAGHRKGLIHGRLAPEHIFLTKSGRPMLLRFHVTQILLARRCGRAADIAIPGFTPPELLLADGKKGPWSDVYASGATLYSIITGKRPPEAIQRQEHDAFPDILHKENEISKGLKKVLNRAMALDGNDRQQTIQELKQEILEQMPAISRPYTPAITPKPAPQDTRHEQEIELEKAKTAAEDIATLSREALAKSTLKVIEPDPQFLSLSLEEIDSERANQWLPETNNRARSGDGILFKKEPVIETNPMGPLASDLPYLSPEDADIAVTARAIDTPATPSSIKQLFNSATANRTRTMSLAAIAACILLFTAVGLWSQLDVEVGTDLPTEVQAAESIVVTPVSSQQAYMLLLAKADSLQKRSHEFLVAGDTLQRMQMYSQIYDVYEQILEERPADSFAIAQMQRINALTQALEQEARDLTIEELSPELAAVTGLNASPALQLIAAGDSLLSLRDYEGATRAFSSALDISPNNSHATAMLIQIETDKTRAVEQRAFQNLIRQGQTFLNDDLLEDAQTAFSKAVEMKPNNRAVRVHLNNVKELIAQKEEASKQFTVLKEKADELFEQGSYASALINYESAQLLQPDNLIIEEQIKATKENLTKLESIVRQRDSQYETYKQSADSLYDAGLLDDALAAYRITEALKPADTHVQERIAAITESKTAKERLNVDEEGIFLIPEVMPEMINQSDVINAITYPSDARRNGVEGMVIVKMMIDENGKPSRFDVLKGIGSGCDREALRVLKRAQFKPGTYDGEPVKTWHTHPIKFKILR